MRILVIAQTFPYPPDTGSRNVIIHWLQAISGIHEVEFLSVDPSASGSESIPGLPRVRVINAGQPPGNTIQQRLIRLLSAVFKGIPAACLAGFSRDGIEFAARIRRNGGYDVVVLPENATAGYASLLQGAVPILLYKHSVHAVDARDDRIRHGWFNPRWILEAWIVERFESATCRAADLIATVNVEDAQVLEQRYRLKKKVEVIPIGADFGEFPPRAKDPGGWVIGFVGNLDWAANKDAVLWFARHVFPIICESCPNATFRVIGPGGSDLKKEIDDPRVIFTGRVPNVAQELESVTVGVNPVISGTGVRFKLIEFLCVGLPAVTTSLGMLGTGAVHNEHLLVADGPSAFARAVVMLLSNEDLRARLSVNGQKIAASLSWSSVFPKIRHAVAAAAGSSIG